MNAELAEVRDFIREIPPFDTLPDRLLDELPAKLEVRYFRRGTVILSVGQPNDTMFILRSGAVDLHDRNGDFVDRRGTGAAFGISTLIRERPFMAKVTAIEDTLVLVLSRAVFDELAREHPQFVTYHQLRLAQRMHAAVAAVHGAEGGETVLRTRASELVRRGPVCAIANATIHEAARLMRDERTSSLLVMDDEELVGIVTDRDLRNRALAEGRQPSEPVSAIMTPRPATAQADSMAFQLLLEMVGRNIHHIPICQGTTVLGVVSSSDLMRLQHASPVYLVGDISEQTTVEGLTKASERLPVIVEQMVAQDASANDIGRIVTAVGDALERRLITLAETDLGPPPGPYCWVVLGSQARLEQGLSSDQDNALILSDDATAADDPYFLALATKVRDGLAACGYPPCPGDVMAANPRWRQPLSVWREIFAAWIHQPDPSAIVNASIFFDMRPVHGDEALFATLHKDVLAATKESRVFLAHLAKHAIGRQPPLGFFRGFVLEKEGEHRSTLDLKRGGVAAVVELARVHALAGGLRQVNTDARLQAAATAGIISEERATDLREALEFISYVRLRHQGRQVRSGAKPDNFVSPDELSTAERRHLRDAFHIVRRAQSNLAQSLPLQYIS